MKKIVVGSLIIFCGCVSLSKTNDNSIGNPQDANLNLPDGSADGETWKSTDNVKQAPDASNRQYTSGDDDATCPKDMIEIEGEYCPVVEEICEKWIDDLRCEKFKYPTKCLSKTIHKHFCIDKFEWPNKEDSYPEIGFTWYGAKERCESVGKRLCEEDEWNFACEGPEINPYAYGYERDGNICNVDKPWRDYSKVQRKDWDQLYQAVASDSNSSCKSWAGVINMNGNVDEIINAPAGSKFKNESTGGYFGPIRGRCRPKTTVHNESFSFYQLGTRCCK